MKKKSAINAETASKQGSLSLAEGWAALFQFPSLLKRPNCPRDTGSSVLQCVALHLLKVVTDNRGNKLC